VSSPDQSGKILRRVVTGHAADMTAKVLMDGAALNAKYSPEGVVSTLIWSTDGAPASIPIGDDVEDMGARILGTAPPSNGSRFAVITIPAGVSGRMHRTNSLDYVVMIDGELDMLLDEGSVTIKAGDVLVQRGTNHNWCNVSDAPATAAFVLLDAEPIEVGAPLLGMVNA
jgi:quercetin dioxygenase-like cupin family protein